jgi:putative addiction module killer protein
MTSNYILEAYTSFSGHCPFEAWFSDLDKITASRITQFIDRLERGNMGALKSVGDGVHELRMDFGPGYRVYLGRDGERLIILLCGGSKTRQQKDINHAKTYWQDYKNRKKGI